MSDLPSSRASAPARLARLARLAAAHPVALAATAGALALGIAATAAGWATPAAPAPAAVAQPPTMPREPFGTGPISLESADDDGRYITATGDEARLTLADSTTKQRATFWPLPGLADPHCRSFRTADGRYLRHLASHVRLSLDEKTALFRRDATFCPHPGPRPGSTTLESLAHPGWYLRHVSDRLCIDADVDAGGSFMIRPPLA